MLLSKAAHSNSYIQYIQTLMVAAMQGADYN